MQRDRSLNPVSKHFKPGQEDQRMVTGRNARKIDQKNDRSRMALNGNDEENLRKSSSDFGSGDQDGFKFEPINMVPSRPVNNSRQENQSQQNKNSGRLSPKDILGGQQRFKNVQNAAEIDAINQFSSNRNRQNPQNFKESSSLNIRTGQLPSRLPQEQNQQEKFEREKQKNPTNERNQLTETALNAYQIADYSKDKDKSITEVLKKEVNRKILELPKLPELENQQEKQANIRQTVTINNLFSDDFFAGRLSFVWLFIIGKASQDLINKIHKVYRPLTDKDFEMPFCRSVKAALQFFKAPNCYFKVVVDLDNANEIIKNVDLEKKILSIYLYNNDAVNGLRRTIQLKKSSKKIRQCYNDLSPLLKRAEADIQNGNKFVKENSGAVMELKFRSSLPTFIKLNHEDKSEITAYRVNLYGAIKLTDREERYLKTEEFKDLVKRVYFKDKTQMNYLQSYLKDINHQSSDPNDQKKHFAVLRFYVQQNFYYKLTNNMLRVCRTVEEFKPLTIPFNENYHAIKYFYPRTLANYQEKNISEFQLYRGTTLKQMDFENLKPGDYIELLGFMSTSKVQSEAIKFVRKDSDYLLIFRVKIKQISKKIKDFDHGFVDLAVDRIATSDFEYEQEVLLNALNIYKIIQVIDPENSKDKIGRIYLEYGAIFDLYEKDPQTLTQAEKSVLANYRFCIKKMNQIEDHGDVLMKAEEFDKCKEFYQEKIKKQEKIEYFYKLAEAHLSCGQTDEARDNAIKSLHKYAEQLENQAQIDRQRCSKIFQIHQKNVKILLEKEDSFHAKKAIDYEIKILDQYEDFVNSKKAIDKELNLIDEKQNWILKAEKLMKRGQVNLKEGNIINSEKDLKQSKEILLNKIKSFDVMRKQIASKYFFRKLCKCFFSRENTDEEKNQELLNVDKAEAEVKKIYDQVYQLLLDINECFVNVAEIVGDKKNYQKCVKEGREYFDEMRRNQKNEGESGISVFEKAKIKVIQAKVENAFQQAENIEKSYELMEDAIQLILPIDKNHEKVGEYSELLGRFHQKQFKKSLMLPGTSKRQVSLRHIGQRRENPSRRVVPESHEYLDGENNQINPEATIEVFDEVEYKQRYVETKKNFEQALAVMTYRKSQNHPKVFQIRNNIGDIEYEYSRYQEGKEQANIVLRTQGGPKHSQGAKSALLIAKIYLSQGEIKEAFQFIQQSHKILRRALVKEETPIYLEILTLSPIYMEIELYKCKVYNRQMNNDLALTSIKNLRKIGKKKLKDADGVGYLADIYEEMGNILVCQGDTVKFQKYYEKAVSLRQNQMGKYNILNAVCYCTMAKYLIFTDDSQTAQIYLSQAFQIFSRFPYNHPYFWIQLSTMAYLSEKMNDKQNELRQLQESVKLIKKRYSRNHINLLKMELRYADVLIKNDKIMEAYPIYKSLEDQMDGDVSLSRRELIESQEAIRNFATENQKVAIKFQVKKSLKETQLKISNSQQSQALNNSKSHEVTKNSFILAESMQKFDHQLDAETTKMKLMPAKVNFLGNQANREIVVSDFNPVISKNELLGGH